MFARHKTRWGFWEKLSNLGKSGFLCTDQNELSLMCEKSVGLYACIHPVQSRTEAAWCGCINRVDLQSMNEFAWVTYTWA